MFLLLLTDLSFKVWKDLYSLFAIQLSPETRLDFTLHTCTVCTNQLNPNETINISLSRMKIVWCAQRNKPLSHIAILFMWARRIRKLHEIIHSRLMVPPVRFTSNLPSSWPNIVFHIWNKYTLSHCLGDIYLFTGYVRCWCARTKDEGRKKQSNNSFNVRCNALVAFVSALKLCSLYSYRLRCLFCPRVSSYTVTRIHTMGICDQRCGRII